MEERLKKIEEMISDHDKRLQALENPAAAGTIPQASAASKAEAVIFSEDGRPIFNVLLPHAARLEIQKTAILLLMKAKKSSEPEMTSKRLSSLLHSAGVDIIRIKDAYGALRYAAPALVTSKPGKRTLLLTSHGEEEAMRLAKELQWK